MTDLGIYLLESSACMAGFYVVYYLFLSRDTHALRNRFYLLISCCISIVIPLLELQGATIPQNITAFQWNLEETIELALPQFLGSNKDVQSVDYSIIVFFLYAIGFLFATFRLTKHLYKTLKLIKANEIETYKDYKLVSVKEKSLPYSFFRYIFINHDMISESDRKHILLHEITHIKQCHSYDLVFVELFKLVWWFNPFIYLLHRSLIETHEFLADQNCIDSELDKIGYQKLLLRNVENQMNLLLTSSFCSSLTLKRIKMIKKINSTIYSHLKLLMIVPVIGLSLFCFSFTKTGYGPNEGNFNAYYPSNDYEFPVASGEKVRITAFYGELIHPIKKKKVFHRGIDVAAPLGTPIRAIADGVVQKVNQKFVEGKGHGRFVIVSHGNGISGLYSQMESYKVKVGQKVKKGDVIGTMGSSGLSTGPHLHFEVKQHGKNIDPMSLFNLNLAEYK